MATRKAAAVKVIRFACIAVTIGFSFVATASKREAVEEKFWTNVIDRKTFDVSDVGSLQPGAVAQRNQWLQHRYGAFAMSATTGWSGWATDAPTRRSAERAALRLCRERGSGVRDCEIKISFQNQCGSVVGADHHSGFGTAVDLEQARELATKSCEELGPGCKVFWEGCSYPA